MTAGCGTQVLRLRQLSPGENVVCRPPALCLKRPVPVAAPRGRWGAREPLEGGGGDSLPPRPPVSVSPETLPCGPKFSLIYVWPS